MGGGRQSDRTLFRVLGQRPATRRGAHGAPGQTIARLRRTIDVPTSARERTGSFDIAVPFSCGGVPLRGMGNYIVVPIAHGLVIPGATPIPYRAAENRQERLRIRGTPGPLSHTIEARGVRPTVRVNKILVSPRRPILQIMFHVSAASAQVPDGDVDGISRGGRPVPGDLGFVGTLWSP